MDNVDRTPAIKYQVIRDQDRRRAICFFFFLKRDQAQIDRNINNNQAKIIFSIISLKLK